MFLTVLYSYPDPLNVEPEVHKEAPGLLDDDDGDDGGGAGGDWPDGDDHEGFEEREADAAVNGGRGDETEGATASAAGDQDAEAAVNAGTMQGRPRHNIRSTGCREQEANKRKSLAGEAKSEDLP